VKLAVSMAAMLAAAPAAAGPVVHTDTHEVRACAPLADGALVGTGGGLVRVDGTGAERAVWTARDGLPGTRVEAIVRDGDGWWIGTDGGGARVRVVGDALTIDRSVASAAMHDIVRHGGALYAATASGVVKLGARGKGTLVPWKGAARGPRTRVAAVASWGGSLFAGTAAGLFILRGARLEPVALDGAHASAGVTSLHADADQLWIATSDGLFVRDARGVRRVGGS
jgi:ligand-binding sensor domain-containing protein